MSPATVLGYEASATCIGCDKPDRECLVLQFAEFSGPHCAKCAMREVKKRANNGGAKEPATPLFNERAHA